ncbi:MAG: radical SAM protein [Candidatus Omnitrophota bacterium]
MKILLIFPPLIHKQIYDLPEFVENEASVHPPLGLMSLAGYLRRFSSHEVRILDANAKKMDYQRLRDALGEYKPALVGITVNTTFLFDAALTARTVKEVNKNTHVCLGGAHVNLYPNHSMRLEGVDSVVVGDGEVSFKRLADSLNEGKDGTGIEGVFIGKTDSDKEINPMNPAYYIDNLDSLPFPARDLVDPKDYYSVFSSGKKKLMTSLVTSRGCPFRCSFCQLPFEKLRMRSPENVIAEIRDCVEKGYTEFDIYDDTFNFSVPRVIEICKLVCKNTLPIEWSFRGRVDRIDKEMLEWAKKAGCNRIQFGIESGSQRILSAYNKGISLGDVYEAFRLTRQAGITSFAYFIVGGPGETLDDFEQSLALIKKIKPDYVTFSILKPMPGTAIYDVSLKKGLRKNDYWNEFARTPTKDFIPPLWEENFTLSELIALRNRALRSFYFRPSYIVRRATAIKSLRELMSMARSGILLFRDICLKSVFKVPC